MRRRLLIFGALAAGLLLVVLVGAAAFMSLQVPFQGAKASSPRPAANCAPAPCADVSGYTLWITKLKVDGTLVSMQVTFKNSSNSTHASPEDLQIIDSAHQASGLITDAPGCTTWNRHEFSNGAEFGPVMLCFRVSTGTPPLVLRWSPDMGLICCRADISLI